MKKITIVPVLLLVLFLSGCGSIDRGQLAWKETRGMRENYKVVSSQVSGEAVYSQLMITPMLPLFGWGDDSLEAARLHAMQQAPEADDIISMRVDRSMMDFIIYARIKTIVTGTAIKYTSGGKSN